eukprot:Platyproteum_vivax@DN4488_c0_g1_i1.p1
MKTIMKREFVIFMFFLVVGMYGLPADLNVVSNSKVTLFMLSKDKAEGGEPRKAEGKPYGPGLVLPGDSGGETNAKDTPEPGRPKNVTSTITITTNPNPSLLSLETRTRRSISIHNKHSKRLRSKSANLSKDQATISLNQLRPKDMASAEEDFQEAPGIGLSASLQSVRTFIARHPEKPYFRYKYKENPVPISTLLLFTPILGVSTDQSKDKPDKDLEKFANLTIAISLASAKDTSFKANVYRLDSNNGGWDTEKLSMMWTALPEDEWGLTTGAHAISPDKDSWTKACMKFKTPFVDSQTIPLVFTSVRPASANGAEVDEDDARAVFSVTLNKRSREGFCYYIQRVDRVSVPNSTKKVAPSWTSKFELVYMAIPLGTPGLLPDSYPVDWGVSTLQSHTVYKNQYSRIPKGFNSTSSCVNHHKIYFSRTFKKRPMVLLR